MGALAGIWSKNADATAAPIRAMSAALKIMHHDTVDVFQQPYLSAGCVHQKTRLVSDFMWHDENLYLSYIGDIRNKKELRQLAAAPPDASMAPILARLYEKRGDALALDMNGVFAVVIYNKKDQTAVLINDRLGQTRIYFTTRDNTVLFASKAKALLAFANQKYAVNRNMLLDLFLYRSPMSYESLFDGIHLLPPATIWHFSPDGNRQTCYWNVEDHIASPHRLARRDLLEQSRRLFNKAVDSTLDETVTFSFGLTSGLDSRCILSAIHPNSHAIECFTRGGDNNPDILIAEKLAEKFHYPHKRKKVVQVDAVQFEKKLRKAVYLTEGLGNMESAAYLDSVLYARENSHMQRQLTGTLGNQTMRIPLFFANKPYAFAVMEDKWLGKVPCSHHSLTALFDAAFAQVVKLYIGISDPSLFFTPPFLKLAKERFHDMNHQTYRTADQVGYKSLSGKLHYLALKQLIQNCFPARNPTNEIYYRTPFIDNHFFEYMAKVPLSLKSELKTPLHRYIIETNNPELVEIPYYSKANIAYFTASSKKTWRGVFKPDIPKTILFELGHRMRTDLKDFVTCTLLKNHIWCFQFLNKSYVTQMVRDHLDGKINATYLISNLIVLELWYQQFTSSLKSNI